MNARYDEKYDILRILFRDARIVDSDEVVPGFILDFDTQGKVVGLEIHDASQTVTDPRAFVVASAKANA